MQKKKKPSDTPNSDFYYCSDRHCPRMDCIRNHAYMPWDEMVGMRQIKYKEKCKHFTEG